MAVATKELVVADPAHILQKMQQEAVALQKTKPDKAAQGLITQLRDCIDQLNIHLGILPVKFSPRAAGQRMITTLQKEAGGAFSGADLREKFGLTSAVLHRRRKEHRIVYWRNAQNDFFYPAWQFTQTGALLTGIKETLQVFKSDDEWRVMRYFLGARTQLGNRRPLDLIHSGKSDKVVEHAYNQFVENTW